MQKPKSTTERLAPFFLRNEKIRDRWHFCSTNDDKPTCRPVVCRVHQQTMSVKWTAQKARTSIRPHNKAARVAISNCIFACTHQRTQADDGSYKHAIRYHSGRKCKNSSINILIYQRYLYFHPNSYTLQSYVIYHTGRVYEYNI